MKLNRLFSDLFTALVITLLFGLSAESAPAQDKCLPVSDEMKKSLAQYLVKKLKMPPGSSATITDVAAVGSTCYRKLHVEGTAGKQPFEFDAFLSPDRRFVSRDLSDSQLDPVIEEQRKAEELRAGLAKTGAPSLGPKNAPVEVVVFSDFECPFCKNAARMIKEIASLDGNKVRFSFRHLPLRMHKWARTAAEATACAQFQGDAAFWKLHDLVFDNQQTITPENATVRIVELAGTIPDLNVAKLQQCMAGKSSSATVSEDMRFASSNGIAGTPTFFVNGHRVQGVKSLEHLMSVIRERMPTVSKIKEE